jgi:hypothetical protein
MNVNDAIKILIEASVKAQKQGVYTVYESREIANAIDEIERISKEQERAMRNAEQQIQKKERQQVIPPVASPLNNE